ncbi:MAG: amidohydrolase family protein [Abitibacteriaceae bacterium]|nr:amidohydrolase family protein [Abditibacteriaceae bacterium]
MSNRITRKEFLYQTVAAATAMALGTRIGDTATPPMIPTIDTHTHFYDPTRPQGVPWPGKGEAVLYKPHLPEHFLALTQNEGIVGTVVVEASPWLEDNQWILDLAQDNPIIVGFIGNLECGRPEFATNLQRFSANPLFRGIRLNGDAIARGLGQATFEDDLRRLAAQHLTLDVVGSPAMLPDVVRVAKLAPALTIVIDHLPFRDWPQDVTVWRHALTEVAQLPNVYAKISDVVRRANDQPIADPTFYRASLDALWELFGPDRALFGSNWPVSDLMAPYSLVHKVVADYFSHKDQSAAEKFFWKNSHTAYRWIPRGATKDLIP